MVALRIVEEEAATEMSDKEAMVLVEANVAMEEIKNRLLVPRVHGLVVRIIMGVRGMEVGEVALGGGLRRPEAQGCQMDQDHEDLDNMVRGDI